MRKRVIVIGASSCIALALFIGIILSSDDRSSYELLDVNAHSQFIAEYQSAQEQQLGWIKDPQAVAARFASAENYLRPVVHSIAAAPGTMTLIVEDTSTGDDSVAATQYRIELRPIGERWEVARAEQKHRCRFERVGVIGLFTGYGSWTTKPCP